MSWEMFIALSVVILHAPWTIAGAIRVIRPRLAVLARFVRANLVPSADRATAARADRIEIARRPYRGTEREEPARP